MLRSFFSQITRLSLRFKWITILLTVIALVLGVVAALQLNQDLLPSIEFPQTFVITFRAGTNSEDMRDLVTIPLEQEFAKIRGVIPEGLESTTAAPVSFLTVRSEYNVSLDAVRKEMQAAIERVNQQGVPLGLKTTADLTPEIITDVLKKAPSMFRHFESSHLLALSPEVLNAALAVNPGFFNQIDLLARDQLAAARVSATVTGTTPAVEPVELPSAWRVGEGNQPGLPQIINFSLSDIPVITASIFSTDPNTTPTELKEVVQKELADVLKTTEGVASVSLSGGQLVPPEVAQAAEQAVANLRAQEGQPVSTPTPDPNPGSGDPAPDETNNTIPALPETWRVTRVLMLSSPNPLPNLLKQQFNTTAKFDTAADLLAATDGDGKMLTAAQLLNQIQQIEAVRVLLANIPAEVLAYVRAQEPDFAVNLSDEALAQISASVLANGAWGQLLQQEGFKTLNLTSLADLAKVKGSVAATLNSIVANTPETLRSFAIRIVDALTPEAVAYVTRMEPDFATKLDPQVLRSMNADALKALPAEFVDGLGDAALRDELKAIIADPTKAAINALQTGGEQVVDDPNAPAMPQSWITALTSFGINVKTANDLFKPPFASPAAFFNQAAAQGGALFKDLPAELLIYIGNRDPNFFNGLRPSTLALLSEETLKKLPAQVQARVQTGPAFEPTANVTRTDQRESLLLTVIKDKEANTVVVSDKVDEIFREVQKAHPELELATVFEQASFIRESIEGVVREGGLGAVGAVLVILFFLNFSVRSTLVTAVSIPTSIAIALILMRWVPPVMHQFLLTQPEGTLTTFLLKLFPANITLNIMTLSGLTVAIGRVVDDAIVVLENIYRQLHRRELSRLDAVIQGSRDVSVAIFAATLTTVVVFLPIGLTGGLIGEFFLPFGLAVTYALLASFVVALTIVPVLALLFIDPQHMPEEKEGRLERAYTGTIKWALSNRVAVMAIATVSLFIGLALFATRPTTFLPALGEPQISVNVTMPAGTPLGQTDARMREFERYLETKKAEGVKQYQITIGRGGGFADIASFVGGSNTVNGAAGSITVSVEVAGAELASLTQDVRAKAEEVFGKDSASVSRATISEQGFGGFAVLISGPEADIRAVDKQVVEALSKIPGLTNITSSLGLVGDTQSFLRVGSQPAVQYTAELEVTDTLGVTRQAIAAVRAIPDLPATLTVGEGFQSQQQTEGFAQTFGAMGIAVVAVYLVMLVTFGSLVHPFTILFSLPLAVVGAALLLTVTDRVVGISALVGMLMLIGIVVTNAIVFIDRVQQNRKDKGMDTREALIEGGRTRLRPILMTAIGTMVALLPLALGLSKGAIIATELGTVVIGGLFSSTILTLLVVPVVYSLFDNIQRRIFGNGKAKVAPSGD